MLDDRVGTEPAPRDQASRAQLGTGAAPDDPADPLLLPDGAFHRNHADSDSTRNSPSAHPARDTRLTRNSDSARRTDSARNSPSSPSSAHPARDTRLTRNSDSARRTDSAQNSPSAQAGELGEEGRLGPEEGRLDPEEASDDRRHRRRGEVLERAIYDAVLAELGQRGFGRLSYEGVAERASTGKAALYRRWPTKVDLVVSALTHAIPDPASVATTGHLRADLLSCLRSMAEGLAGPTGTYLRGMIGELHQHPELATALRQRLLAPRQASLRAILAAGVERGDVRLDALSPECVDAGPALLRQRFLELGPDLPDETITAIVDNVLLPMVRPASRGASDHQTVPAADRTGAPSAETNDP